MFLLWVVQVLLDRNATGQLGRILDEAVGSERCVRSHAPGRKAFATFFKSVIDDAAAAKTRRRRCLRPLARLAAFVYLLFFDSAEQFVPEYVQGGRRWGADRNSSAARRGPS